MSRQTGGFTLIELAIVMVVVTLLLGGLLVPLTTQIEQRRVRETQQAMDEIKEALLGFAMAKRYLPCPAVSATNGAESARDAGNKCIAKVGYLPWEILGVAKLDAWGQIFRYAVDADFTANAAPYFSLGSTGNITIQTRDAGGALVSYATNIPAVIVSHGKNAYLGATDNGAVIANDSANNPDEITNAGAAGTTFVTRAMNRDPASSSGEFDDLVAWISPNILFNRMVAAGRLP